MSDEKYHSSGPDFIIIGTQKGGTSSLYSYLGQHSQVELPTQKEIHFFDLKYIKGIEWYKDQFPSIDNNKVTGEASPYYIFHPFVAKRVYNHLPKIKLIVMLRNPIDRAYSNYMMQIDKKIEPLTFELAIEEEDKRLEGEIEKMLSTPNYNSFNLQKYSYIKRGEYYSQIKNWLKYFNLEQFHFIKSEDFFNDPTKELFEVHDFLDIKQEKPISLKPVNTNEYQQMNPKTRKNLSLYFAEESQKLSQLIGNNFNW